MKLCLVCFFCIVFSGQLCAQTTWIGTIANERGTLSDSARQLLSEAAHRNRPWEHATGPTSQTGKAKSAANGGANEKENPSDNSNPLVDRASDILKSMSAIRKQLHFDPLTATASDGNDVAEMLRETVFGAGQEETQNLAADLMRGLN